jgi:AcrR family transcriptional regulator
MGKQAQRASEKLGRPRLFDDDTERRMVMDAAVSVMARNDYAALSVADILAEAGLSTSSFYRHFASKEALLGALVRREAESAQRYVERAIEGATNALDALESWLEAVLDLFFEPRKAARTSLFSTPQVMSSTWMAAAFVEMSWVPSEPLVKVLRAGHESGQMRSPNPEADAVSIFAVLSSAATSPHGFIGDRAGVQAQVQRFARGALQIADSDVRRSTSKKASGRRPAKTSKRVTS